RVEVRDTGIGVPEEEQARIFDRFYQVERVVSRKAGGTGLGLSIVKSLVQALGGELGVQSFAGDGHSSVNGREPGGDDQLEGGAGEASESAIAQNGTMFYFTLPAAPSVGASAGPRATQESGPVSPGPALGS